MHILFANTGVQLVCIPLRGGSRYQGNQIGYGWQRCRAAAAHEGEPPKEFPFVQWQIIQSGAARLFLAVDTSCGEPELGYFCSAASLTKDFMIRLDGLLDMEGKPLKGIPPVEVCIRPATATAGDAKHVHMVVDFGNSRTGALLGGDDRGDFADAADAPLRVAQPLSPGRLGRRGRGGRLAGGAVVLLEDPLVQHALSSAAAAEKDRVSRRRRRGSPRRGGSAAARSLVKTRSRWSSPRRSSTTSR